MLNKILFKLFGLLDNVKAFLFHWGLRICVVLMIGMIVHNILKMSEISSFYKGEYKTLVSVREDYPKKLMNSYTVGSGPKTVVIMPGFGSSSPIIQYKTIVELLRLDYRVSVVEYFGYGYSMSLKAPRTNEEIAMEVKNCLEANGVYGPYVLCAHDTSSLYAMCFQQKYPDLVQGIITIDGKFPKEIDDNYRKEQVRKYTSNINITSIFELTGYERIASYISPSTFYIERMKTMPEIYTKQDLSIYRNRIGSQYLSRTMVREVSRLEENMEQMKNYVYPEYLPVLQILASDTKDAYAFEKQEGLSKVNLTDLAEGTVVPNNPIHKTVEIKGDKQLQLSKPKELVSEIRTFLIGF